MGLIREFIKKIRIKKIEGFVEETKKAEDPLEKMLEIAEQNPEIVDTFIQKVIETKDISDHHVAKLIKEIESKEIIEQIAVGIENLPEEINLNPKAAPEIVKELVDNSSNSAEEKKQRLEQIEDSIPNDSFIETKKIIINEEIKREENEKTMELYNNKNFRELNHKEIHRQLKDIIGDRRVPQYLKENVNKVIAKKIAYDYGEFGGTKMFPLETLVKADKMMEENYPELVEKEYRKLEKEEKNLRTYEKGEISEKFRTMLLERIKKEEIYNKDTKNMKILVEKLAKLSKADIEILSKMKVEELKTVAKVMNERSESKKEKNYIKNKDEER